MKIRGRSSKDRAQASARYPGSIPGDPTIMLVIPQNRNFCFAEQYDRSDQRQAGVVKRYHARINDPRIASLTLAARTI